MRITFNKESKSNIHEKGIIREQTRHLLPKSNIKGLGAGLVPQAVPFLYSIAEDSIVKPTISSGVISATLTNPEVFEYDKLGHATGIRQVTEGKFKDYVDGYDGSKSGGKVTIKAFSPAFDIQAVTREDIVEEKRNLLAGMPTSSSLIHEATITSLGNELDKIASSGLIESIGVEGRIAKVGITGEDIVRQAKLVRNRLLGKSNIKGTQTEYFAYLNSTGQTLLEEYLSEKVVKVNDHTGWVNIEMVNGIVNSIPAIKWDGITYIQTPDNALYTEYAKTADGDGNLKIEATEEAEEVIALIVPANASAFSVRHASFRMLVPADWLGGGGNFLPQQYNPLLEGLGETVKTLIDIKPQNIQMNPNSDNIEIQSRVLSGLAVVDEEVIKMGRYLVEGV